MTAWRPKLDVPLGLLQMSAGALVVLVGSVFALAAVLQLWTLISGPPVAVELTDLPREALEAPASAPSRAAEPESLSVLPISLAAATLAWFLGRALFSAGRRRFDRPFEPEFDVPVPVDADTRLRQIADRTLEHDRVAPQRCDK